MKKRLYITLTLVSLTVLGCGGENTPTTHKTQVNKKTDLSPEIKSNGKEVINKNLTPEVKTEVEHSNITPEDNSSKIPDITPEDSVKTDTNLTPDSDNTTIQNITPDNS